MGDSFIAVFSRKARAVGQVNFFSSSSKGKGKHVSVEFQIVLNSICVPNFYNHTIFGKIKQYASTGFQID